MQLTEKWSLEYDSNNVILTFKEERENKKKEMVEFVDEYFYPTVQTALRAFLQKSLEGSKSVEDCLSRIDQVEVLIKKIK